MLNGNSWVTWGIAIAVAVFLTVVLPVFLSSDFSYCQDHNGEFPTRQAEQNNASTIGANDSSRWVFASCLSGFFNVNSGAYTALATVVLTFLTGILGYLAHLQFSSSRTQLRAFVFVPGIQAFFDIDPAVTQPADPAMPRIVSHWGFRPTWQNSGATPTRNMTTHVEYELRDRLLPPNFPFTDSNTSVSRLLVGPQSNAVGGLARSFTVQEILDVQAGRQFLYLWGWIRYRDVFAGTRPHITRYCVQVTVNGDPTNSSAHFNYSIPSLGNCSDEECVALGLG